MTEYIFAVALFIGLVFMTMLVIPSFSDYCLRILKLVALDYP